MPAINSLQTESEKSEQRGFANLLKGTFSMFRNPTAHAPRVHWKMDKSDAEDLLSLASLADIAQMTSRFAEIIPPYHRRGNRIAFAAIRWALST